MAEDKEAHMVFDSMVKIKVGDSNRVLFWRDCRIHGFAIVNITPSIYHIIEVRTRNRRTVLQAMDNSR